jgi:hypothetical protein
MGLLGSEPTHAFGSAPNRRDESLMTFGLETAEMFSDKCKSDARI